MAFVPASRRQVFSRIKHLVTPACPLVNLAETRWGEEPSAEKMREAVWLRPEAVAQIEFLEWTEGGSLSGIRNFVRLRDDKDPGSVVREHPASGTPLRSSVFRFLKPSQGREFK